MSGETKQKQVQITESIRTVLQKLAKIHGLKQQQIVALAVKSLARQIDAERGLTIRPQTPDSQPPKPQTGRERGTGEPQAGDKAKNRPTPGKTRGKPIQPLEPG